MKVLFMSLVLVALFATTALAASRTATWDANPAQDEVIFYTLYMDGFPFADVYGTSHTFELDPATHMGNHETFVTATNADGESDPSNVVAWRYGKPSSPKNHKVNK
jgi:hypothetical protein